MATVVMWTHHNVMLYLDFLSCHNIQSFLAKIQQRHVKFCTFPLMIRRFLLKEFTRHITEQSHHLITSIQECAAEEDAPAEKNKLHHVLDKLWAENITMGKNQDEGGSWGKYVIKMYTALWLSLVVSFKLFSLICELIFTLQKVSYGLGSDWFQVAPEWQLILH